MIDSLRDAFRQAVENFRAELNRDRVPEAADQLLRAMHAELIEFERQGGELENDLARTKEEATREKKAAETCVRREEMAKAIGDNETAGVARDFAAKHLVRLGILEDKVSVLERQLEEHRSAIGDMKAQFKRARTQRESLSSTAGRTDARESMRDADRLFDDMDRIAEGLRDFDAHAEAARELDEALGDAPPGPPPGPSDAELEARLEALKRKMDRS